MVKRKNETISQLDLVFQALSDTTRREMVQHLSRDERTIGQLAEPFAMSMPAVTKHVKVLVEAGLVSKRRRGKFIVCRLETEQLASATSWLEKQRAYWEDQLDRFAEFVEQQPEQSKKHRKKKRGKK